MIDSEVILAHSGTILEAKRAPGEAQGSEKVFPGAQFPNFIFQGRIWGRLFGRCGVDFGSFGSPLGVLFGPWRLPGGLGSAWGQFRCLRGPPEGALGHPGGAWEAPEPPQKRPQVTSGTHGDQTSRFSKT